ncbi:rhamnan synthesis F family protein [Legionella gresilensis]|uniref:rhamnosyltransferase WsaF family glycosyltransferase n=1 Tax=Legionella gresilensis TaxID=91823 RepID=UPI0010419CC1|nr:rhamnan synthesis F family protein [Legionella gresilensis]
MNFLFTLDSVYILDSKTQVWSRPDYESIPYSDGDEVEERLAVILTEANDLSVLSTQLKKYCTNWPWSYHLSSARANILRPFQKELDGAEVLEIGAGCGAVTRFLGESRANVVALEGTYRRAALTRMRTRDLKNVEVVCERFDQFQGNKKFDFITLIGVLEYANMYMSSEEEPPVLALLKRVCRFLKPEGKLIIAIENQLGLKYFAGAPEDHLGLPMYGIEGRYHNDGPQTYGRQVLTNYIKQAGFASTNFFGAFPDYKFPVTIIDEQGFTHEEFDPIPLINASVKKDLQLPSLLSFSPELVWPSLCDNKLALDVANSFLIVASLATTNKLSNTNTLAYHYSTERRSYFCKATIFKQIEAGVLEVHYHLLEPKTIRLKTKWITHSLENKASYISGKLLIFDLIRIVTQDGWHIREVGSFLRRYINIILSLCTPTISKEALTIDTSVSGECFDMGWNIIISSDGQLHVIDKEWIIKQPLSVGFILFRCLLALTNSLSRFGKPVYTNIKTRLDFFQEAYREAGFEIDLDKIKNYCQLEANIYSEVIGLTICSEVCWPLDTLLPFSNLGQAIQDKNQQNTALTCELEQITKKYNALSNQHKELFQHANNQNISICEYQNQLEAIKNSLSWKVSKPIRIIGSAMLKFQRAIKLANKSYQIYKEEGYRELKGRVQSRMKSYPYYLYSVLISRAFIKFFKYLLSGQLLKKCRTYGGIRKTISNFLTIPSQVVAGAPIKYCLQIPLNYSFEKWTTDPEIAVICHMFYVDLLEEISGYLKNIPFSFDLFITTNTQEKKVEIENYFLEWAKGSVSVKIVENRGRDIAPKLIEFAHVYSKYEFFLHIHTKKSPHYKGMGWRNYLFETLLGSEKIIQSIFEAFRRDKDLGMIAPEHFHLLRPHVGWANNFKIAQSFAEKLGIKLQNNNRIDFPSGSMFWGRSASLKSLLNAHLTYNDFPIENQETDATLAHAIERLYFFICEHAGYKWIKITLNSTKTSKHDNSITNPLDLAKFIDNHQYKLINNTDEEILPFLYLEKSVYERSDYKYLGLLKFQHELHKLIKGEQSLIDFNEEFYLAAYPDVAKSVASRKIPCGYIHYCLNGKDEGRIWSNNQLQKNFSVMPNYPTGLFAPKNIYASFTKYKALPALAKSKEPFLLILFSHLQEDIFYGGYTAFFNDFAPIFTQFKKIVLSVECEEFTPSLATRYAEHIEVIHESELKDLDYAPTLIICFNHYLFHKASRLFNDVNKTIYYCQEFEACDYPLSEKYIEVEKAIYSARNLILSTEILKRYLVNKNLVTEDKRIFITSPKIEPISALEKKTKKLFFYFRPECFNLRNLSNLLRETAEAFCMKHQDYTIYMVGTVDTRYSYEVNGTQIYVLSKLSKQEYVDLLSSCDVVVSMIYSAHPGIIAYQAAASGIPSITNTYDNRDKAFLKKISKNIVPYDPIRDDLLELIEYALTLPKGNKDFNEQLYSGQQEGSLSDYVNNICKTDNKQSRTYLRKVYDQVIQA